MYVTRTEIDSGRGTGDIFFDVKWSHWLADTIPGATRSAELEDARRLFPGERSEELSDELRAHWNRALSQPRWTTRTSMNQTWTLVGPDREPYASDQPGTLGGHRRSRIYGRLDCAAALRAIARGGYVTHRVFFLSEDHARAAGYRPCGVCLPAAYASWKAQQGSV